MKRNLKVKGNGDIARCGQKEAGRERWTKQTGSGYKAGGLVKAAMDAHDRYFIRRPDCKSDSPHQKASCLILRDPYICPRGLPPVRAGVKDAGKSAEAIVVHAQWTKG